MQYQWTEKVFRILHIYETYQHKNSQFFNLFVMLWLAWLGYKNTRRGCGSISALSEIINECCQLVEENVKYCKVDNIRL